MYKFSHIANDTAFSAFLSDEDATIEFGRRLARSLKPGMVVFLEGDLGAGKTTLTRGILRGFDFTGRVKSPTYTLVEPYSLLGLNPDSKLYFYHFDLYRFNDPSEWEDAGFRDYFNSESICLIEWADKASGQLPTPDWIIQLQPESTGRSILLSATSELGQTCQNALTLAAK
ncbi:tRNA (adenosine(37)-N6)-threonylcarbamoyltransferase complex ATPase subunit type 1 TsaE [Deefgea tanakiae]|jgi:tRNA threonylcarbamoyladenosine biosynthesis protein TsaE|uniref:tRNA threonylcarbamoyladenosine biosynthesis protein TsaE n=1 Tax=Deefgea tanakiae TaxID=2865840 RepID=A0ABX8ZDP4_9NEIS|nr:tRNA (adenosine(37)-N6)-threonylcarbamoyltransferase complex ATPase subunit type 1 TsaE [Deefgea tanakiae]QZA79253.1 tRNA (adenosine(37)-N6)-threonylcarbamoyltransferase complex ATPase subunit type 1 TsaE [Deefgea tanakiae]